MSVKRLIVFLSIITAILLLPTKAFATQCVDIPSTAVLNCNNDKECKGFETYVPYCEWDLRFRELTQNDINQLTTYLAIREDTENLKGLWQFAFSDYCAFNIFERHGKSLQTIPIQNNCGKDDVKIQKSLASNFRYDEAKQQAMKDAQRSQISIGSSRIIRVLYYLVFCSTLFLVWIVRYILSGEDTPKNLVILWVPLQILSYLYLIFLSSEHRFFSDIAFTVFAMPIVFLIGSGMLIGN